MSEFRENREFTALAGPPRYFGWLRGGDWVFKGSGNETRVPADIQREDRLDLLIPSALAEFGIHEEMPEEMPPMYPPGCEPYEPLRDTPKLYLEFMDLGELAWANGPPVADAMLRFVQNHGPLSFRRLPTFGDFLDEAKSVARVGMAQRALSGDAEAEKAYWPRALWAYGPGFDSGPAFAAGSAELRSFIAVDIEVTINRRLKTSSVVTQLRRAFGLRGQPPGFESSFAPVDLRGAIWAQLAASLIRGSTFRRCKFTECRRMFVAPSPRSLLAYCPDRDCQVKANDRIKYERRKARKSKGNEAQEDGD